MYWHVPHQFAVNLTNTVFPCARASASRMAEYGCHACSTAAAPPPAIKMPVMRALHHRMPPNNATASVEQIATGNAFLVNCTLRATRYKLATATTAVTSHQNSKPCTNRPPPKYAAAASSRKPIICLNKSGQGPDRGKRL